MNVAFFTDQDEFRKWLEKHYDKETERLVEAGLKYLMGDLYRI